jgi:Zn-dependent oligopeptidase
MKVKGIGPSSGSDLPNAMIRRLKVMKEKLSLSVQKIERLIHVIRDQKVMLDADLAELYGVETRALKQAVRRNQKRFPNDFMFELTREEIMRISQIVTSSYLRSDSSTYDAA